MSETSPASRAPRIGFQTKLLIPVVACLVLLPVIVGAIVTRYLDRQQQETGRNDLSTAKNLFVSSLDSQRRDLLLRFRPVASTTAVIAPALKYSIATPETIAAATGTIQEELDQFRDAAQASVYFGAAGNGTAPALHEPIVPKPLARTGPAVDNDAFALVSRSVVETAWKEGEATGIVTVGTDAFYVVAVPVTTGEGTLLGVLDFGVRLDVSTLDQLRSVTGAEIVLTGPAGVLSSTLPARALPASLSDGAAMVNGVHYLTMGGSYDAAGPARGFQYTLLYSIEDSLRRQAELTRWVAEVSVAAVILSVAAVWYFTRRSMRPLHELRDSAEAVGRGDFSRRITRYANDECGDLADAFNRMTGNLQQSRAELQTTVDTLQNTQAQLIQSEKLSAVGQFVSGVAHELNNPLAAVIGFSELLAQTSADEKIRPHLDMIAKSAQRCHKIVQNLLSFARQHPPERKLVGINAVVEEVLDFMAYEFRTSNITIQRQLAEGLPAIVADPHQLQQVFVNILGNARQAIQGFRRDGKIIARTSLPAPEKVRVEFIDDGPGIRPENLSRIFDPFFTTKPVGKGTGLGLSLTYGIVKEHGGTIHAESVVGHGATFVIDLPVTKQESSRVELPRAAAPLVAPAAPSGRTVLVVDDEDWLLALASDLLRQDGHIPVTAHSGEAAIDLLGRRRIDLIISDWKMPGLSGAAFYEHLQAVHPRAAERIFFMTGDVMNDALQEFMARHGKTCLAKPFPIGEFRAAVTAHLAANPA